MKLPLEVMPALKRTFADGTKFISQEINGKTYRQLFDKDGRQLVEQVKSIERFNVGNKKVINITKNTAYSGYGKYDYCDSDLQSLDKVYSKSGQLLGSRLYNSFVFHLRKNGKNIELSLSDLLKAQESQWKMGNYTKMNELADGFYHSGTFEKGIRVEHDVW